MSKTPEENVKVVEKWLGEISKNNNHELEQTRKLKIILFNLKIICANQRGVTPIVNELAGIIEEMNFSTQNLVTTGREELRQAFGEIKDYLLESEGK